MYENFDNGLKPTLENLDLTYIDWVSLLLSIRTKKSIKNLNINRGGFNFKILDESLSLLLQTKRKKVTAQFEKEHLKSVD